MSAVARVGIIGVGTMGSRIAFRCALTGKEARIFDIAPRPLEQALALSQQWITERQNDGRLSADEGRAVLSRMQACTELTACIAEADLIIESVPEELELKRKVFAQIDQLAPTSALIATNSSSIPCSRISDGAKHSDKIFNINFTDPSSDDDLLVELMKGTATSDATMHSAEEFVKSLGMVPITTQKEIMGFSFNRIWRVIKREALHLVDGRYIDFEDIDRAWMLVFGTPIGLFGKMDWIGLDVVRDIEMQYYLDSGDLNDKPPKILENLIAQGRLGVKSGQGFYSYPNPSYTQDGWLRKEGLFNKTKGRMEGVDRKRSV